MMSADVSARLVDARIITSIVSLARPNIVVLMPSGVDRSPTLMATTRPAPIARTTSAGTLFITPPSTSIFPSTSTGGKASGSDIVARMASASEPLFMTTGSAERRSTATVRNGVGRSSKSSTPKYGAVMRASISSTACPLFRALGGTMPPSFSPNSRCDG